jgi:heme exporter protein A
MPTATSPAEGALELRKVSKFFNDLVALNGVHLRVARGEAVLLYGPNGAGKTTLLRTLAGLSHPTEGEVLYDGSALHRQQAAARTSLGFVSHQTFLYGELTGYENLKFAGTLFGLPDLGRKIDEALALFGVLDRARTPVRELSRGLQQRVSLARAFLHGPQFVLLDEPFTGLDAATSAHLIEVLKRLPGQSRTVIFSTHDFGQGAAIARRLVAMERGQIRYDGPMDLAPLEALGIRREAWQADHA